MLGGTERGHWEIRLSGRLGVHPKIFTLEILKVINIYSKDQRQSVEIF